MTIPAMNVFFDANLSYDCRMKISPEPITVSATVLSQMFLCLDSLKVDINGFLRSLDIEPESVKSPDARIPAENYLLIQDSAADYVNDPYFDLSPLEVVFIYPGPESTVEYERVFCCPVRFGQKDNSMTLSINKVAKELAVSVRTLQNYLDAEGVVFSDLLRDIRQRLAQKYLRENHMVEQITYLLEFSEPSVFRKAFKKWSGITPREYRENKYYQMEG